MSYTINPKFIHITPLITHIDHYFEASTQVLYDKRNVIRVVEFEGERYVVKAFKVPNTLNRFAYRYLRPSKAKRSYNYSLQLGAELTPTPIAYIENTRHLLLSTSYYISTYFDYDHTIHEVLTNAQLIGRKKILKDFAHFTFKLHEQGIFHQDYSHGNILIKTTRTSTEFKIIDLNRMTFCALDVKTRLAAFAKIKANDDDMSIIITQYLALMNLSVEKRLEEAKFYRDEFYRKRGLKNKLRGYFK